MTSHDIPVVARCQACLHHYDGSKYLARVLPCKHVLCSDCILKLSEQVPYLPAAPLARLLAPAYVYTPCCGGFILDLPRSVASRSRAPSVAMGPVLPS